MAWIAQGVPPLGAACLGVYLHGRAADLLREKYGLSGFSLRSGRLPAQVRKDIEESGKH